MHMAIARPSYCSLQPLHLRATKCLPFIQFNRPTSVQISVLTILLVMVLCCILNAVPLRSPKDHLVACFPSLYKGGSPEFKIATKNSECLMILPEFLIKISFLTG